MRHRYLWLDASEAREIGQSAAADARPHIDTLAAYLMTTLPSSLFSGLTLTNVFFSASGRPTFALPMLSLGPIKGSYTTGEALDLAPTRSLMREVAAAPESKHSWIQELKHWQLASVREDDQWKKFLWTFFALELLVNRVWEDFYDAFARHLEVPAAAASRYEAVFRRLLRVKDTSGMKVKFALCALALDPQQAPADTQTFDKIMERRNDLAHGQLHDAPASHDVRSLLDRYMAKAVDVYLRGRPPFI